MKYSCGIIRDLLPLYIDGVCSEESKKAMEEHLSECSDCKDFYGAMRSADKMEADVLGRDREHQKAASFQAVKKKLFRKQILAAASAVFLLAVIAACACTILNGAVEIVEFKDNISVSMVDGDLIGRLQGSQVNRMSIKRVITTVDGQEVNYLFFFMENTKWDELTTGKEVFSERTLCYSDKGADQIDAVYYFTGEYRNLESLNVEELQGVINASELLWSK